MSTSNEPGSAPSRKRRRPPVVCTECRRRKSACDRKMPCAQCTQHSLVCIYQNDHSTPQRSAPGLSRESLRSANPNTSPEHSRMSVTACENSAANVASPPIGPPSDVARIGGTLNDSTLPIPGVTVTPALTASSSMPGTLDQRVGPPQPQNRVWVNFDGTLVPTGHPLSARDDRTRDHKGRYLKSRLVGQSHWMNSSFQVSSYSRYSVLAMFDTEFTVWRTAHGEQCITI